MSASFRRAPDARPRVYGHRGVRGPVPENTMRAFARARDEGADGIELDVRPTLDGEIVVHHDPDLRRTTGGFDSRHVADLSRAELARIDLGDGERIPTLAQVLEWIASTELLLNLEIKRDVPDRPKLVRAVARTLARASLARERCLVSSFDPFMLAPLALLLPGVTRALLFHAGQAHLHPWTWARYGPWQAVHPEHVMLSAPPQVRGRIVNAWTVNDPVRARALAALGVDGLITDRPADILRALRTARDHGAA